MFRHVGLNKNGAFLRIDTTSQIQGQRIQRRFTQLLCILAHGDRVLVNDTVNAMVVILHVYPLTQRTHVVTNGQFTWGLCATKNDGLSHFSIPDFRYAEALMRAEGHL